MSRRARQRSQHVRRNPRAVASNAIYIAINGARALDPSEVDKHMGLLTRCKEEFAKGLDCERHWCSLADATGMARTLAGMGLGSGPDAELVIDNATTALKDAKDRHAERGTWTLYADEIDALHWLLRVHDIQLRACSFSEFERAFKLTEERARQALAGNASPGAVVVVGEFGERAQAGGLGAQAPQL